MKKIKDILISLFARNKKKRFLLNNNVFALVDPVGKYVIIDPLTDQIIQTTEQIEMLQIWDIHYPIMEDYFINEERYKFYQIKYLTKSEKQQFKF